MGKCLKCDYYRNKMCPDYKEVMEKGAVCDMFKPHNRKNYTGYNRKEIKL